MARDPKGRKRSIDVVVLLGDDSSQDERPAVTAYAYRQDGRYIGSTDVSGGRGSIELPPGVQPDGARVYIGPPTAGSDAPARDKLRTKGALLAKVSDGAHRVEVDSAVWRTWLRCGCLVRGRVVKRQTRPDGTVVELPVCHTRVHIYDVDRWWLILQRIPDLHLYRIRDELLDIVRSIKVPPRPQPGPDPGPELPHALGRMTGAVGRMGPMTDVQPRALLRTPAEAALAEAPDLQHLDLGAIETVGLSRATEAPELRRQLVELGPKIAVLLCSWPWLEPFYRYSLDEIGVVDTDDDGYFSKTVYFPCFGDHPDLYFQVEQERNGIWDWVYRPWVRCTTWWNFACGSFVTLRVTDPTARTCEQGVPIDPPDGLGTTWVMPLAVGGLYIRGYAGTDSPDGGWVRTDGLAEDGLPASDPWHGIPFGFSIALRLAYEVDIPTPAVTYYRLNWRAAGGGGWHPLDHPVHRYYEKHVPGQLFPSFPAAQMGPDSVGGQGSLFKFRPHDPPGPAATDPPGTTTNWPAENFFGDIYHGYLDTVGDIPAPIGESASHGDYELGLELFSDAGVPVPFGPASVVAIFPDHIDPDLTVVARLAAAGDFDGPACVFPLKVDNRLCKAAIGPPTTSGSTADECGMLHGSGGDIGMDFTAWREGGYATFGLSVTRGLGYPTLASTSGRVTDPSTPSGNPLRPWTGNGAGHFVDTFPPVDLLDTCDEAAFAVNLGVYAKVTTGSGQPQDYDDGDTIAFAVVE